MSLVTRMIPMTSVKFPLHHGLILLGALTISGATAAAQTLVVPTASAVTTVTTTTSVPAPALLTPEQLDQLTASIALYPDPLLASTLAAASYPADVTVAAQWLAVNPAPADEIVDMQPWQPAVKALVRYPNVLNLLAQYPAWTQSLGTAYSAQPADIMASVQRLRSQAYAMGNLATTTQQQVIVTNTYIQVVPVEPTVVYVPVYDPRVVYVQRPMPYRPYVSFSVGVRIGNWMDFDLDWHDRRVVTGVVHDRRWYQHRETPVVIHPWTPERHVIVEQPRVIVQQPIRPVPPAAHVEYRGWGPQPQRTSAFEDRSANHGTWTREPAHVQHVDTPRGNPSVRGDDRRSHDNPGRGPGRDDDHRGH